MVVEGAASRPQGESGKGDRIAFLDQALWRRLADAQDEHDYLVAWLTLQSRLISGCRLASVLMHDVEGGVLTPAASWPDGEAIATTRPMAAAVEAAVQKRAGAAKPCGDGELSGYAIALPIYFSDQLEAVVALEVECRSRDEVTEAMRRLQWGSAWLEALLWRRRAETQAQHGERMESAMALLAPVLEAHTLRDAADSLTSELASWLGAERVALGMRRRGRVRVISLSHTAMPDRRMQEVRAIALAMEEALDQELTLLHPPPPGQPLATLAHASLVKGDGCVISVPMFWEDRPIGVITLEFKARAEPDQHLLDTLESVAAATGPVLDSRRRNDRWFLGKAWDGLVAAGGALFGPRHLVGKSLALLLAGLVAFMWFSTGSFRVTSDALIESSVQRSLAAPFDGYVADVWVRPGDVVDEGQLLATLDATDQELELLHWRSMQRQHQLEYERALAEGDRSAIAMAQARLDQAGAQADLAAEQVRRSRLVAPFDAYVLSGDLSRSVGAALARGEPMLELAPLEEFRVVLMVDEGDIEHLASDQEGQLVLAAAPDDPLAFEVERVTSVSQPGEGQNRFRIEAVLSNPEALQGLRPGMEGVAKVMIDERRRAWIWTHNIIDWIRLRLWRWWP